MYNYVYIYICIERERDLCVHLYLGIIKQNMAGHRAAALGRPHSRRLGRRQDSGHEIEYKCEYTCIHIYIYICVCMYIPANMCIYIYIYI